MHDTRVSLLHKKAIHLDMKVRCRRAILPDTKDQIHKMDPSCDGTAVRYTAATGWIAASCRIRRHRVTRSTIARIRNYCSGSSALPAQWGEARWSSDDFHTGPDFHTNPDEYPLACPYSARSYSACSGAECNPWVDAAPSSALVQPRSRRARGMYSSALRRSRRAMETYSSVPPRSRLATEARYSSPVRVRVGCRSSVAEEYCGRSSNCYCLVQPPSCPSQAAAYRSRLAEHLAMLARVPLPMRSVVRAE